jgi:DNA repair protein RecN (Recombination protein N)
VLEELRIRGLGVIEDAVLPLGPGLTVVTGETGAGKTMVVTGLLLLFGGRADAARVRAGADQAVVDGRLELAAGSPAAARVLAAGGELDDGTGLVLRRAVAAAGRSRAYVGGAPAPVAVLTDLGDLLLAVHGQADQQHLVRPAEQRAALDRFAGLDLSEYRAAYDQWRAADADLADRTARAAELRRESDLLVHGIGEIEAVAPEPGEDTELAAVSARLTHADGLRSAAGIAHDLLLGNAETPLDDAADVSSLLGTAARALSQQAGDDAALDAMADRLADLAATVQDLGAEFGAYAEGLDADPARLEQVEARRAHLIALIRKYGTGPEPDVAGVLAWRDEAQRRLLELDVSDEALAALAARRDAARARTAALAAAVSQTRAKAAGELAEAVTTELAGLAMPTAAVTITVRHRTVGGTAAALEVDGQRAGAGPDGVDEVDFGFRSHAAAPPLPLGRAASGGELSRVMLALELCLHGAHADGGAPPTMIFDEVDAGVGGRAAVEIGRRLARLARDCQVLVVTHLAQVAAFADRHLAVDKNGAGDAVTTSDVRLLEGEQRIGELARMLAGSDSDTAREHAAELLATAATDREEPAAKPRPRGRRAGKQEK